MRQLIASFESPIDMAGNSPSPEDVSSAMGSPTTDGPPKQNVDQTAVAANPNADGRQNGPTEATQPTNATPHGQMDNATRTNRTNRTRTRKKRNRPSRAKRKVKERKTMEKRIRSPSGRSNTKRKGKNANQMIKIPRPAPVSPDTRGLMQLDSIQEEDSPSVMQFPSSHLEPSTCALNRQSIDQQLDDLQLSPHREGDIMVQINLNQLNELIALANQAKYRKRRKRKDKNTFRREKRQSPATVPSVPDRSIYGSPVPGLVSSLDGSIQSQSPDRPKSLEIVLDGLQSPPLPSPSTTPRPVSPPPICGA